MCYADGTLFDLKTFLLQLFLGCDHFKIFGNKRYIGATTTLTKPFSSQTQCIRACHHKNSGCQAVSVIATDDVIACEMMGGLNSRESEIIDDESSTLLVMSTCSELISQNIPILTYEGNHVSGNSGPTCMDFHSVIPSFILS